MAEDLEQRINGHKTEEKPEESEFGQFGRGFANTLVSGVSLGASYALFGLDGLVTAASFPIGGFIEKRLLAKKKDESKEEYDLRKQFKSKNLRDESIGGALFTVPLLYGVNLLRRIPQYLGIDGLVNVLGYSIPASALAVGGITLASTPLFNAVYYPITHFVNNKTFKGAWQDLKEQYKRTLGRSLVLSAFWAGTVAYSVAMPAFYTSLFPVLAGFEVAYRVILSREKLKYLKLLNPFTYVPNWANPFYLAEGLASLISKAVRPNPKPAQALAPQPAH